MEELKKRVSIISLLLSLVLLMTASGCSRPTVEQVMNIVAPQTTPIPGADTVFEGYAVEEENPLYLTYKDMDGSYSPFWAETDGDLSVARLTQLSLRAEEDKPSPADISRTTNADGSVTVTVRLHVGLCCPDGVELTADYLLFTYYVLLDEDYDGPYALKELPIRGLSDYWNDMRSDLYFKYITMYDEIYNQGRYDLDLREAVEEAENAARENGVKEYAISSDKAVKEATAALEAYDTEKAALIRDTVERYWRQDVESLVPYTMENYAASIPLRSDFTREEVEASEELQIVYTMMDRSIGAMNSEGGFTALSGAVWDLSETFPTMDDLFSEMYAAYDGDVEQYWAIEGCGRTDMLFAAENEIVLRWAMEDEEWEGEVKSIAGIEEKDKLTLAVTLEVCDEEMLKTLCGIFVAPLHVYGDAKHFNPKKNEFGVARGDLTAVRALSDVAVGAGEFVLGETVIRTVNFTPNENYWLGVSEYDSVELRHG